MNRKNAWLILNLTIVLTPWARADVTYIAAEDNSLTTVRMTVTPAAEPVPAFKHCFVARDIDLKPGNAAPYYYRAMLDLNPTMDRVRKEFGDDFDTWYIGGGDAIPIRDLPLEKVRKAVDMTNGPIHDHLRHAAQLRECDWELGFEELRGVDVIAALLPEFQQSRELGRILSLQTRLATAEQRYADAIEAMRMNYRLGRDVANEPILVCGLIGIAIAGITNGTATELIAAPNSPNLYWALAEMPQPLVDLRPSARFEIDFGPRMFPFIHQAESTDRSPQEWNRLYAHSFRDLATVGPGGMAARSDTAASLAATAMALAGYSHAKSTLIAQGLDRERVEKMSVGQVMAVYTERNYRVFADEFAKLWYVPFPELRNRDRALGERLGSAGPFAGGAERDVLPIVTTLLPALQAARTAQVRLERDIAALRVIEALRMYAATHDGRLPARLADIDQVPIPNNPVTDEPFVYRLEGATAVLELPSSDGIPGFNRRFEIQIATKVK